MCRLDGIDFPFLENVHIICLQLRPSVTGLLPVCRRGSSGARRGQGLSWKQAWVPVSEPRSIDPLSAELVRAVGEDEVKFQPGIVDVDVGGTCYGMNKRPGSRSFPGWRSGGYRHDTDRYSVCMEVDSGRFPHRRPCLVQKAARATLPS